ncbi:MAG: DUF1127 domain-containing protein [Pseudomonadota bacterium]
MTIFSTALGYLTTQEPTTGVLKTEKPKSVMPLAKHAGFSKPVFDSVTHLTSSLSNLIQRRWSRYQARRCAQSMLSLSDHVLADMALTRADIWFVLKTKSDLDATDRLKLMSVERRASTRTAYRRRASYLNGLVPDLVARRDLNDNRFGEKV